MVPQGKERGKKKGNYQKKVDVQNGKTPLQKGEGLRTWRVSKLQGGGRESAAAYRDERGTAALEGRRNRRTP